MFLGAPGSTWKFFGDPERFLALFRASWSSWELVKIPWSSWEFLGVPWNIWKFFGVSLSSLSLWGNLGLESISNLVII